MMLILSPAKSLIEDGELPQLQWTEPRLLDQSERIHQALKKKSVKKLKDLQSISESLAQLNYERNQVWTAEHTANNSRPAILTFDGDVYKGFEAESLSEQELEKAQNQVRILSGLYGLLRPLDLMQPYRLEMGTDLKTTRGKDLYKFWGDRITKLLAEDLNEGDHNVLVNLASNEYAKSVDFKKLDVPVIEPEFKDWSNGKYKIISFFAKKARGMMARYIVENNISKAEDLQGFTTEGYAFDPKLSEPNKPVFTRMKKD
jgi:cytoplasmic iron level regulating protein YaaA (DUF328/UPF0246 family)